MGDTATRFSQSVTRYMDENYLVTWRLTMAPKAAKGAGAAQGPQYPAGAGRALFTVLIFSGLMVTCPFLLYFASFWGYFDSLYALTIGIPAPENRAVASAIAAVLGVNLVVGAFIFVAFREVTDDSDTPQAKAKKDN
ncbi:hypothetical protein Vafri_1454 [Volvox africanus]|nr:hypothetical protein Vafri_1454 [Volvox africanus]